MPVTVYRSRDRFALEHPAALDRADVLAAEESRKFQWLFDHAIFDRKRRHYIVSYCSPPPRPEPCILTLLIEALRGQYSITVYQRFE